MSFVEPWMVEGVQGEERAHRAFPILLGAPGAGARRKGAVPGAWSDMLHL